ncbi:hypothetical protein [Bacillus andreraoultii]|uniref:hypothetical protein n=1 Tax=Bacillus andreraoultii TaxID=1499685 RepID=UPI000539BD73|nr:hypothetical protein [Bacillus andreraoultii]
MITYETHVFPFQERYKKIIVPEAKVKRINEFVTELIKEKEKESHHSVDNRSHFKRYYTGTLGEVALEEYLGTEGIVDWTIGNSNDYHKPDLSNIGVRTGIKTVEYGSFPIIFKNSYSPEIVMIKVSDNHVVLCGLATKNVLNTYQSDKLVKDKRILQRGTKTGFYGFEYLKAFSTLDELKEIAPAK